MRQRFVVVALAITSMVVLSFVLPLAILVRDVAEDGAMVAAERQAQGLASLLLLVGPESDPSIVAQVARAQRTETGSVTVYLANGDVVGDVVPEDAIVRSARILAEPLRFETEGGQLLAVPVVAQDGTSVVRIFVPDEVLRANIGQAWLVLSSLGFGMILLSILAADRLARSAVEPIRDLADAAQTWADGDLHARVEPAGPPEVERMGRSFNQLADRFEELLTQERESVADLSHRLRTPLTALRLNLETVDDDARAQITEDVDALERQVTNIIDTARRPIREGSGATTDLADAAARRVAFWAPLAEEQDRRLTTDFPSQPVLVPGARHDVDAAIDALITNVLSHTASGTHFRVTVQSNGEGTLIVEDGGPGFDPALVERGVTGADSTGLGLDIVRRTAEAHGGSVAVRRGELGGAQIVVRFSDP